MPKVYLSASTQEHNLGKDGVTEEARMQALAKEVAAILGTYGVTVYQNNPTWDVTQVVRDSKAKRPDIHVALHSNSGGASGTETWVYKGGPASEILGKCIHEEVVSVLGLPDRGYKDGSPFGVKKAEVADTAATACLIELFFHDNATDIEKYKAKRGEVGIAVAKGMLKYLGIPYVQPTGNTVKPVPSPADARLVAENATMKAQILKVTAENNELRSRLSRISALSNLTGV